MPGERYVLGMIISDGERIGGLGSTEVGDEYVNFWRLLCVLCCNLQGPPLSHLEGNSSALG